MDEKEKELQILLSTPINTIWDRDLEAFLIALQKQEDKDE
jgi:hypothetical protein